MKRLFATLRGWDRGESLLLIALIEVLTLPRKRL